LDIDRRSERKPLEEGGGPGYTVWLFFQWLLFAPLGVCVCFILKTLKWKKEKHK
jgi:hypothetical protein